MSLYEVFEKIAEGGFGYVHRAKRKSDGVQVAIKYLHGGAGLDEFNRFKREITLIQNQSHPHIIKLLDFDLSAKPPYFVMPYMSGGPLTRWAGILQPANVRIILRNLVDVLAYLHSNNSVHRDVKPDNILVDGNGQIAVSDFGLGNNPRFTVKFTVSAVGTPGYAAPELMKPGGTTSAATDIFSLGATIFHIITGVHPRDSSTFDPRIHRPDVPNDLRDMVLRLTQTDPVKRPTAIVLRAELNAPVPTTQTTTERGGFTPRQSPTIVSGGRYG